MTAATVNQESKTRRQCLCGCGEELKTAKALYRPGHDSRHVGMVARRVVLTGNRKVLDELPSEALRARAERAVTGLEGSVLGEIVEQQGWKPMPIDPKV